MDKKHRFTLHVNMDDFIPATDEEKSYIVQMRPSTTFFKDGVKRLCRNKVALVSLIVVAIITLSAILIPAFWPYSYDQQLGVRPGKPVDASFNNLAPFEYGNGKSPYLREAQCRAQELIPNSGMICTNDLVEPYEFCNVHPKNKRDVGYRLAFMALNKTYGMKEIACQSPQYESMEIRDGKARIRFKYMDQGFNRMADIRGFEICGADKVFYPADAVVENQFALVVSSEKVPEPVAVRYCFRDFQPGNLADTRELPVVPFRTDDF